MEVRGENFEAEKGAETSLGKGRGCVFGSSPKLLEQPKRVHWWLLVHSTQGFHKMVGGTCKTLCIL